MRVFNFYLKLFTLLFIFLKTVLFFYFLFLNLCGSRAAAPIARGNIYRLLILKNDKRGKKNVNGKSRGERKIKRIKKNKKE